MKGSRVKIALMGLCIILTAFNSMHFSRDTILTLVDLYLVQLCVGYGGGCALCMCGERVCAFMHA